MDSSLERRIREFLTAHRAVQFDFLASLVRTPSEAVHGDCGAVVDRVATALERHRLSFQRLAAPEELCGKHGRPAADNLVVHYEFGPGPKIVLSAHVDTAPIGDGWSHDPLAAEIVDGRMFGRGVVSAKGDVAAYLFALLALIGAGRDMPGTVELHITVDGESGGDLGARWLVETVDERADFAIASGPTHALVTSASGYMRMEAIVKGRSAPASDPGAGADAVEASGRILNAFYELRARYAAVTSSTPGIGHPVIVVTDISGGESRQTVAAGARLQIERRLIPEECPMAVERELTSVIGACMGQVGGGVRCKVRVVGLSPAMAPVAATERLVAAFQKQAEGIMGGTLDVIGMPGDTDGRHYAAAGTPTLLFGDGLKSASDANVGGPDEVLELDDQRTATEMVANTVAGLLSEDATPATRIPAKTA